MAVDAVQQKKTAQLDWLDCDGNTINTYLPTDTIDLAMFPAMNFPGVYCTKY